jgi:hypothetical protein
MGTNLKNRRDNDASPTAVVGNKPILLPTTLSDVAAKLQPHPCPTCRENGKMLNNGPCPGHVKAGSGSGDAGGSGADAGTQPDAAAGLSAGQQNEKTSATASLSPASESDDDLSLSDKIPRLTLPTPRHAKLRLSAEQKQLLQLLEIALGRKIPDRDIAVVNDTLVINMHDSRAFQRLILIDDKELQMTSQSTANSAKLSQQLAMFNSFKADLGAQAKYYQAAMKGGVLVLNIANPAHYQDFIALLAGRNEATQDASQQRTAHPTPNAFPTKPRPSWVGKASIKTKTKDD